jgi:3-oxoacyl-(acyl-carrier-protein) synthase
VSPTADRTVIVTGLGALNAAGTDTAAVWSAVQAGESRLGPITRFDADGYPIRVVGEIDADVAKLVPRRFRAKTDRFTHLAFVAGDEALADAGIDLDDLDRTRVGVWFGNNTGGWEICERGFREYYHEGADVVNPWQATAWFLAAPQGFLTIRHGVRGISKSFSGDRTSGAAALYHAYRTVERGRADLVLAGGCEAPVSALSLACFHANGEMSEADDPEKAYRPFAPDSAGTVVGEGAAALILEDAASAAARGASARAVIAGGAHGTALGDDPAAGYATVIRRALADADAGATDIDLVLCDGSGHAPADAVEAGALAQVFGGRGPVPVSVPKAVFGHLYGAAFATDVVLGCLAARDGVAPPTAGGAGLERPLELLDTARKATVRRFLVCARSRYGACVALVVDGHPTAAGGAP